jgi:dinuclear metal center YbgI/SA1388 family protein
MAVKRITADGPSALIHDAIRRGVAIYSPHTAWDAAPGGSNDLLADAVGVIERTPLRCITPPAKELKLVTFVPEAHAGIVSNALFASGAGQIGNYSSCSFRTAGIGTFLGGASSNPAIGKAGRLETPAEIRLETIVRLDRVTEVIAALKKAHPYEEPAFDLTVLAAPPTGSGQGRIGNLPAPASVGDLVEKIKRELNLNALLVAGDNGGSIHRVAVCAGSGGEFLDDAITSGADLYLTGELRHHDALKAARAGVTCICALHSNSERPSLMRLKSRLEQAMEQKGEQAVLGQEPPPELLLSQTDREPFSVR